MVDEITFLTTLAERPNDETRLVYADWLDEHGQPEKAEFLRLEHQLRTAKARIESLGPCMDVAWLGAVYGYNKLELVSCAASNRIEIIKLIRELTGLGLKESKDLSENLPSVVLEGSGTPLLEARSRFQALGAEVRMIGSSVDMAWIVALLGGGGLELLSYPDHQKISVIKAIREVTGLGLKEAKDMSESLPALVLEGTEDELRRAMVSFRAAGAKVQLTLRPFSTR